MIIKTLLLAGGFWASTTLVAPAHPPHGGLATTDSSSDTNLVVQFTPFLDPLPIPANAVPVGTTNGRLMYDMPMTVITNQRFHSHLPPVEVWGYAGTYPGPTIQATNGQPIYVHWRNQLPATYPPWILANLANHGVTNQDVRNVVHLHGGATRPEYDGHPTNTFKTGESRLYLYENIDFTEDGETLWYHDHALGVTANNVYAGLAGLYLLRDLDTEIPLNLPKAPYEVPLVFQDRDIQTNGTSANLYFPPDRTWYHLPVVNGKIAPYFQVEARKYRFRMLNGCLFRTLGLALNAITDQATNTVTLYQIGTDDGFLTNTVAIGDDAGVLSNSVPATKVVSTLRLMPGERADVLVDFSAYAGQTNLVIVNSFSSDSAANPPGEPINVVGGQFMQFWVQGGTPPVDSSQITNVLVVRTNAAALAKLAKRSRTITLDLANELQNQTNQPAVMPNWPFATDTNVFALLNLSYFDDPVTETPTGGDVEIWEFVNLSPYPHPMHIHLIDFLLLERLNFIGSSGPPGTNPPPPGVMQYIVDRNTNPEMVKTNLAKYLDNTRRPTQPNEGGPKDVIHAAPWAVTRVVIQWPDDPRFVGPYVYHCHILDHEDSDMMRPMELLLPPGKLGSMVDPIEATAVVKLGTQPGVTYQLEESSNLATWSLRATVLGTGLPAISREPLDANGGHRFYRALSVNP